jgi:hypothetical protein
MWFADHIATLSEGEARLIEGVWPVIRTILAQTSGEGE